MGEWTGKNAWGQEKTFGGDGYIHYLFCVNGLLSIKCQKLPERTFEISAIYCMAITAQ